MDFSKSSRDRKICRDQKMKQGYQAFRKSFCTYLPQTFHPDYQNFEKLIKQHPKNILSNKELFKQVHLEDKNHGYHDYVSFDCLSGRFKKKIMRKGKNKGKSVDFLNATSNHQKWHIKKTCCEDDIVLIHNFKDNSYKKPDDNLPKCEICFYNNSGFGKKYFKDCQHGSLMCSCCARAVWKCPFCRKER